jgi:Na+-transporting methylmalonyl-CoA/oxaloacetate decarboxylase gamma subunit
MDQLLSKLESYRIFNYLFPGSIFIFACEVFGIYKFNVENLIVLAFVAYFLGMTISRVGSLILEKPLEYIGFIKKSSYDQFITAEKEDEKISKLVEEANTYRTIVATALMIGLASLAKSLLENGMITIRTLNIGIVVAVLSIYIFAYRKQVKYVVKRVNHWNKKT